MKRRIQNPKLVVVVHKKAKVHETAPGSYMRTSVRNKRKTEALEHQEMFGNVRETEVLN